MANRKNRRKRFLDEYGTVARVKHAHPEAFMLMMYKCEHCNSVETVWNSRDGVTPFIIGCGTCKRFARHILWGRDLYNPLHKPSTGDFVFIGKKEEPELIVFESQ